MASRIWSHQKDVGRRGQVMCFFSALWRVLNDGVVAFYHLSGVVPSTSFERGILNSCFLGFKRFLTYILDGNIAVVWICFDHAFLCRTASRTNISRVLQDLPVGLMSGLQLQPLHWEASPWLLHLMLHVEGLGELSHMFGHRRCLLKAELPRESPADSKLKELWCWESGLPENLALCVYTHICIYIYIYCCCVGQRLPSKRTKNSLPQKVSKHCGSLSLNQRITLYHRIGRLKCRMVRGEWQALKPEIEMWVLAHLSKKWWMPTQSIESPAQ